MCFLILSLICRINCKKHAVIEISKSCFEVNGTCQRSYSISKKGMCCFCGGIKYMYTIKPRGSWIQCVGRRPRSMYFNFQQFEITNVCSVLVMVRWKATFSDPVHYIIVYQWYSCFLWYKSQTCSPKDQRIWSIILDFMFYKQVY